MASPLSVKKNDYHRNPKRQDIPTPPVVANFIATLYPSVTTVFDPCMGGGNLLRPFKSRGVSTFGIDIKTGQDFLETEPTIDCDLVVCNPPFNLGVGRMLGSEQFLRKILEVVNPHASIVLFVPMGYRLNQRQHSKRWRWMRDNAPQIDSILSLPLDIFPGVEFHNEILFFRSPHLRPHYWIPTCD